MAAESGADVFHGAPRCPLGLFDAAVGDLAEWSEFDAEAERLSIQVRGLPREELRALIESSTREIPTPEHRRLHQKGSAFVWWGRRGGLRILALYGRPYFSLLARFRWGHVPLEALTRHRAGRLKGRVAAIHPPQEKVILFDLAAYEQYLAGELVDLEHSEEEIERAVATIPD